MSDENEPRSILEFLQTAREKEDHGSSDTSGKQHKKKGSIKAPEQANPIWIDREGKRYPVSTMETKHIYAVLNVFERHNMTGDAIDKWVRVFNNELERRKAVT